MGLRGNVLSWFDSYLKDRSQYVQLNSKKSKLENLCDGVPQGSVLGPILYLVYVNFITNINLPVSPIMFADDTVLMVKGKCISDCEAYMTKALEATSIWLKRLKLTLNLKKCKLLYVNNLWISTPNPTVNVSVNGLDIELVNKYKYLGIIVDQNISFKDHAITCIQHTWQKLILFSKVRYCLDDKTALELFKAMILPVLEFGNIFCLHCPENIKEKLQRLQNKGLKIALKKETRYPTFNLHLEASLSSYNKRAEIAQCILAYRYVLKEFDSPNTDVRGICKNPEGTLSTLCSYGTIENICQVLRIDPISLPVTKSVVSHDQVVNKNESSSSSYNLIDTINGAVLEQSYNTDVDSDSSCNLTALINLIDGENVVENSVKQPDTNNLIMCNDNTSSYLNQRYDSDMSNIGVTKHIEWSKGDFQLDFELTTKVEGNTSQERAVDIISDLDSCIDLNLHDICMLSSPEIINLDDTNVNNNTNTIVPLTNCESPGELYDSLSLPYNNMIPPSYEDINRNFLSVNKLTGQSNFFVNLEGKTRGSKGINFNLDGHRTKSFVHSLSYKLKNRFNSLPLWLREIDNYRVFKDHVKVYLKSRDDNFPT